MWPIADKREVKESNIDESSRGVRQGFVLLIALLALTAAGKAILHDTLDPDCFWHLKVAEALHRQGIGPLVDDLSFASNKSPWTPYSWLAELGMKAVWDLGGYRLAVAAQALMQAGIVIVLAMIGCEAVKGRSGRGRYLSIVMLTAFGTAMMLPYLSFRPATAGILLLGAIFWLVVRDWRMNGRSEAVWLAVPLTVLLTNIHLYVVIAPAIFAMAAAGTAWNRQWPSTRRYGLLTAACGLGCLMTPMLWGAIQTAWFYQHNDAMVAGPIIAEMRPFLSGIGGKINGLIILAMIICLWRRRAQLDGVNWLWLGFGLLLLLRLGRFAPLYALLAMPAMVRGIDLFSDRMLCRPGLRLAMAGVLLIGCVRVGLAFPRAGDGMDQWVNRHGPDTPGYPTAAAEFVQANVRPHTGHLINEFTWGGYLSWRFGGQYQVLLDGRTQLYSRDFWRTAYLGDESLRSRWLNQLSADAAVLPMERSVFAPILIHHGWTIAYRDQRAQVLIPPAAGQPAAGPPAAQVADTK